jgi:hypothetical protein
MESWKSLLIFAMCSTASASPAPMNTFINPSSRLAQVPRVRRNTAKLSDVEKHRRHIQAAKMDHVQSAFSPEYLASWNDLDVYDNFYFRQRREEGASSASIRPATYVDSPFPEERTKGDVERALRARYRASKAQGANDSSPLSDVSTAAVPLSPHSHSNRHRKYSYSNTKVQNIFHQEANSDILVGSLQFSHANISCRGTSCI